jgi:hypothetical protein
MNHSTHWKVNKNTHFIVQNIKKKKGEVLITLASPKPNTQAVILAK